MDFVSKQESYDEHNEIERTIKHKILAEDLIAETCDFSIADKKKQKGGHRKKLNSFLKVEDVLHKTADIMHPSGRISKRLSSRRRSSYKSGISVITGIEEEDETVNEMNIAEPVLLKTYERNKLETLAIFPANPDLDMEGFIAVAGRDHKIYIESIDTSGKIDGKQSYILGDELAWHTQRVTCLKVYQPANEKTRVVVSASKDCLIKVWVIETKNLFKELRGHQDTVFYVDIVDQQDLEPLIVSCGLDGHLMLWSLLLGTCLRNMDLGTIFSGPDKALLCCCTYFPQGDHHQTPSILFGGEDEVISMWTIDTGEITKTFSGHLSAVESINVLYNYSGDPASQASYSLQADDLMVSAAKKILVWSISTGLILRTIDHKSTILTVNIQPLQFITIGRPDNDKEQGDEQRKISTLDALNRDTSMGPSQSYPSPTRSHDTSQMDHRRSENIFDLLDDTDNVDDVGDGEESTIMAGVQAVYKDSLRMMTSPFHMSSAKKPSENKKVAKRYVVDAMIVSGDKKGTVYLTCLNTGTTLLHSNHHVGAITDIKVLVEAVKGDLTKEELPVVTGRAHSKSSIHSAMRRSSVKHQISSLSSVSGRRRKSSTRFGVENEDPSLEKPLDGKLSCFLSQLAQRDDENEGEGENEGNEALYKDEYVKFDLQDSPRYQIFSTGYDGTLKSVVYDNFSLRQSSINAYESDRENTFLSPAIRNEVPDRFRRWSRVYYDALSRNLTLDEYFSGESFCLFHKAIMDGEHDFVNLFLPECPTGFIRSTFWPLGDSHVQKGYEEGNHNHTHNRNKTLWEAINSHDLAVILHYLNNQIAYTLNFTYKERKNTFSLLRSATYKKDVKLIRCVLSMWEQVLNQPCLHWLDQCNGASTRIQSFELIPLARIYPLLFKNFIINLKLQQVHPYIMQDCSTHLSLEKSFQKKGVKGSLSETSVWKRKDNQYITANVVGLYVPLCNCADPEMLTTYRQVSEKLNDVEIFQSDVGLPSIRLAWSRYGLHYHLFGMLFVGMYILAFTKSVFEDDTHALIFTYLFILSNTFGQVLQMIWTEDTRFLLERKPVFEMLFNICVLIVISTLKTPFVRWSLFSVIIALSILFQWIKALDILRPFISTGPIIAMIYTIVWDIKYYLVLLFIILGSFASSFWVICAPNTTMPYTFWLSRALPQNATFLELNAPWLDNANVIDDYIGHQTNADPTNIYQSFNTLPSALLNTYIFVLGAFEIEGFNSCGVDSDGQINHEARDFAVFIAAVFAVVVVIMMINVLIAIMTESYSRLQERGIAQSYLNQAQIIEENSFFLRWRLEAAIANGQDSVYTPRMVHVLKRKADYFNSEDTDNENDGAVAYTKASLAVNELYENLSQQVQALQEDILDDMQLQTDEFDQFNDKLGSIVKLREM